VTLFACLTFSIVPAVRATRSGLYSSMRMAGPGRYQFVSSKALVALQVALSVMLLIGAGLLIRTVLNLRAVPLGYDPGGILMIQLEPRFAGYSRERRNEFFENAVRRLEQIPSVRSATGSTVSPIGGVYASLAASPGQPQLAFNSVGPRFFETWRWPVLAGREIEWSDRGEKRVAIINQAFARRYFEGRDPIGAVFRQQPDGDGFTIVGVVADSKNTPREKTRPLIFPPYWQVGPWMTLAVRTEGDPGRLLPEVRQVLAGIDPAVDILEVNIPAKVRDASMNSELLFAGLLVTLGAVALLLCAIGLSGTLAYITRRRFSEIGIRMALGAHRADVVRMLVRESIWPVAAGVAAGVGAALPLTWFVRNLLFGVPRYDPWSIVCATAVFLIAAALAAFVPARRAALIDPMRALREE
jgi:predicted permease